MHSSLKIAYFSMEFGIQDWMKTYCGGLGILAGDTIKSASDLGISMTGVTLLHKDGWFKQIIDPYQGQKEEKDTWNHFGNLRLLPEKIHIWLWDRKIALAIWEYEVVGINGYKNKLYFLDSDLPENNQWDRQLTNQIYPTNKDIFLAQEMLLGVGGLQMLEVLGLKKDISVYHLNESHCMAICLVLKHELGSWEKVREKVCFTTHTPLASGQQTEEVEKLKYYLEPIYFDQIPQEIIKDGKLNFTSLCIYGSKFTNGVSKRHQETTSKMYPEAKIEFVTNGVHPQTWISPHLSKVFNSTLGMWKTDIDNLLMATSIKNEDLWQAHQNAKKDLLAVVNLHTSVHFDPEIFTIGFARRAAPYKRADLIFTQFEKLQEIAQKFKGLQLVFSGKALPGLSESNEIIKVLLEKSRASNHLLRIVFLPDYSMKIGQLMTSGVDVWLNNPLPPLEASGTSGMKASINGVPNFSIMDGWWPEAWVEGETGWSIGKDLCEGNECRLDEISDLYYKLENEILPTYYYNREKWLSICKNNINQIGSRFNTHKMLLEYVKKGYLK